MIKLIRNNINKFYVLKNFLNLLLSFLFFIIIIGLDFLNVEAKVAKDSWKLQLGGVIIDKKIENMWKRKLLNWFNIIDINPSRSRSSSVTGVMTKRGKRKSISFL